MMVPSFVVVVPAIDPDLTRTCLTSMCAELKREVLVVDNTETKAIFAEDQDRVTDIGCIAFGYNIGVAASWNIGIDIARDACRDYLIIVSQSVTFGAPGGEDLLAILAERRPEHIAHSQHGWHLLAVNMGVLDRVGVFDPMFPHYGTDTDFLFRMGLAGLPSPRENGRELDQVHVDAECLPNGETVRRKLVTIRYADHLEAYARKFGGPQGAETYTHPYGRDELDWTFVGEPPEGTP